MRRQVVKGYLTDALFRLMERERFRDISVRELTEEAGVCRASFYRNFLSMEQIVDEWIEATLDEAYQGLSVSGKAVPRMVASNFHVIKAHRKEFSTLQRQGLLGHIDRYIYERTLSSIEELGVFDNRYQPHYFAGAASALVKAWIEYGFEESEEEMIRLFFGSLHGYL